jgi:hypothetical protein
LSEPPLAKAGDGATWHPAGKTFLFPKSALATRARAGFRDAFARLCPDADLPPHVWQIPWVVHITPWAEGQRAALDYLARYAFRIAITNNRILAVDDATVTYRYKDRAADRDCRPERLWQSAGFPAAECWSCLRMRSSACLLWSLGSRFT